MRSDLYGEPLETITYSGKYNYQDKARTVLTAEKKMVQITGNGSYFRRISEKVERV